MKNFGNSSVAVGVVRESRKCSGHPRRAYRAHCAVIFAIAQLSHEVPHWLYISKFTRLRAVSRRQHGSCTNCWVGREFCGHWKVATESIVRKMRTYTVLYSLCVRTGAVLWGLHCFTCTYTLNKSAIVKLGIGYGLFNKLHKTNFCAPYFAPPRLLRPGQLPPSAPRSLRHRAYVALFTT